MQKTNVFSVVGAVFLVVAISTWLGDDSAGSAVAFFTIGVTFLAIGSADRGKDDE